MFYSSSVPSKFLYAARVLFAGAVMISLLICSLIAPVETAASVVVNARSTFADIADRGGSVGAHILGLGPDFASDTLVRVVGKTKNLFPAARPQIDRIVIKPGALTVMQGQRVSFTAAAFNGDASIGGVTFEWSIRDNAGQGTFRRLASGNFEAKRPGSFIVKASYGGRGAQVSLTVVRDREFAVTRILRTPEAQRTEAQRQEIERLRAAGLLTTRATDSRRSYPTGRQQARIVAKKREESSRHKPAERASYLDRILPDVGESATDRGRGPRVGYDESFNEAFKSASSNATPYFFNVDPLGWDSGNWAAADDRNNWVGRPLGATKDAGAGNGNFTLAAQAVSLPGRGIDINLNLHYNSRLWSKANSVMTYNADAGYPAPGWSLGFGRMIYTGTSGGCMMVAPDGTRRSFSGNHTTYTTQYVTYDYYDARTTDGSMINYACFYYSTTWGGTTLTATALMPDGSTIFYGTTNSDYDQAFPTRIGDRHGNYIDISYVNNEGPEIDTITDTLGRTITFNYDSGRLINISGPGYNGTTRTFLRLHYAQKTLSYGFDGSLTTSVANGSPYLIDAIYYPTKNTGFWLGETDSYSSYGMLAKVIGQRGMSWSNTGGQGTVTSGTMTTQDVYNYPMTASSSLTDAPTYTTLTQTWDTMDNASATACNSVNTTAAVTCYSVSTSSDEVITVTLPDGSKSKQTSKINASNFDDGLWVQTEILNPSNTVLDKTKIYLQEGTGSTEYNSPRTTKIEHTDDKSQMTTTELTYATNSYNQVSARKEYGYSHPTLYREQRYTYENNSNYINRHIFSLVKSVEDYDGSNNRLTRTEYEYDNNIVVSGAGNHGLVSATGVVQHDFTYDPYTTETCQGGCIDWYPDDAGCEYEMQEVELFGITYYCECEEYEELSAFNEATAFRGDLTKTTQYTDAVTPSGAISESFTYDITGNERTASASCCQEIGTAYSTTTQYSQPDTITRGSSNPSSADRITESFSYDTNTKVPTTVTDYNGLATTIAYDAVSRPTVITLNSGGKKTITYGDSTLSKTELIQKSSGEGSGTVSNSTVYTNGRGQMVKTTYQAGASNHNATQTKYDVMGRRWKVSMPFDTGSSPSYWTEFAYDYLSRMTSRTAPDGSTTTISFSSSQPSSASSNSGTTVLTTDAWGRQRWTRSDAFGRLVEAVEPNPAETTAAVSASGNIATSYAYDQLDQLTGITQGSQTRSFKYDSLGRLTRQKLAEQTATINDSGTYVGSGGSGATWSDAFVYDTRSNITQRTDARGVKSNFSYLVSSNPDPLNRLQSVSYDTSSADTTYTINSAPTITFEYMTTGDKTRVKKVVTDGVLYEENAFDSEGRISSYEMKFDNRTSYPFKTEYTYDTAYRLTQVKYPKRYGMTINSVSDPQMLVVPSYDQASRLSQMTVDGNTQLSDISYNTSSQVTSLKTGAATSYPRVESYTYDAQTGLLTAQTVKNTAATSTYLDLSYSYNRGNSYGLNTGSEKTGQLTKILDNLDHNRDKLYEFDALGRIQYAKGGLAAGASSVTADWTQTYSYDRYGNKTGVSVSGVMHDESRAPKDGLGSLSISTLTNRITTSGWEYDLAGNLIRGQDAGGVWQKFEYDAAGRLKKVKDDSNNVLETYTYGASREKLMVETSSLRTYYAWGGQSIMAEYTETSTTPSYNKSYVYAGSRLLMTATKASSSTETNEFHHPDRLGTQLVTDSGAGTSDRQTTLPFGTALDAESTGFSNQVFTSYDRSPTTGLDYAVNRTYSKGQSRFTQVDPIGMAAASPGDPQSNNLYAYTQNMPTDFVDPSGLNMSWTVCVLVGYITYGFDTNFPRTYELYVCRTYGDDGGGGTVGGGAGGGVHEPVHASPPPKPKKPKCKQDPDGSKNQPEIEDYLTRAGLLDRANPDSSLIDPASIVVSKEGIVFSIRNLNNFNLALSSGPFAIDLNVGFPWKGQHDKQVGGPGIDNRYRTGTRPDKLGPKSLQVVTGPVVDPRTGAAIGYADWDCSNPKQSPIQAIQHIFGR